jgi:hypothetical protein
VADHTGTDQPQFLVSAVYFQLLITFAVGWASSLWTSTKNANIS